ncbi:shootin-1 isoform X1 [Neodiprion fabricii]|uniref:shootin-1 isoform X1 n=1 Tax=Neodiprion fabricii TaxID=2872261 RepID=UPI001ED8F872|nr:shootin-1 isoform X1 [Neodiprion fabricii]XP_046434555.1 shootin-1 isoform X1 [Neodiprion fabricii]
MNKTQLEIVLATEPPRSPSGNSSHSHIPLPKVSSTVRLLDRYPPARRESPEKMVNRRSPARTTSVALQRASFEKGDTSPVQANNKSRSYSSNSPIESRNTEEKTMWRTNSTDGKRVETIRSTLELGDKKLNRSNSFMESKWKSKYEDSEKRRKMLLQKSESNLRDHADLEKKYNHLQRQNNSLQAQVVDNEEKLNKLRTVSEAVCKEYEQLKRQYDIETGAMHRAMQQATQWYKQNRELKRKSQVLAQKFLQVNPEGIVDIDIDISDEVDSNSDDTEQLRETVRELSQDVARLQTELNAAKLQEFEAQEQVTLLSSQLEEERALREEGEAKIKEFQKQRENMERVTRMVADEVQALKEQCEKERENAKNMKIEADKAQKERNVLAHQSSLLLAEIATDSDGRLLAVLLEVESLKRSLEEEQQRHVAQVQALQEKLEERESNVEFEILEEKLKLADTELEIAVQRSECAELSVERLEQTVKELEEKIKDLETKAAQPPAPPLPPPPPPPPMFESANATIKLLTREKNHTNSNNSALSDMENMLGINKRPAAVAQQPAIDDVISQIKGGRFTLKQTDKQRDEERKRRQEAEAAPPAVSEMLTILGTMRRRAKPTRQSFKFSESTA